MINNNYSYHFLPTLKKTIQISLVLAFVVTILGSLVYVASKEALHRIAKSFSYEVGSKLQVWHLILPISSTLILLYSLFSTRKRIVRPNTEENDKNQEPASFASDSILTQHDASSPPLIEPPSLVEEVQENSDEDSLTAILDDFQSMASLDVTPLEEAPASSFPTPSATQPPLQPDSPRLPQPSILTEEALPKAKPLPPILNPIDPLLIRGYRTKLSVALNLSKNLLEEIESIQQMFTIETPQLVLNHMLLHFAQSSTQKNAETKLLTLQKAGADFTYIDESEYQNTALLWSIANANNDRALLLIQQGAAAVHIASREGMTPLTFTIAKGYQVQSRDGKLVTPNNRALALALIKAGADVNQVGKEGYTPLHLAVMQRDTELITFLLMQGANTDTMNHAKKTAIDMLSLSWEETHNILTNLCSTAHEQNIPKDQDEIIQKLLQKNQRAHPI